MVCVDANYFLRALVEPVSERAQREHRLAVALFAAAGRGEVEITATEVVLHEVLYVLTNTRANNGYGYTPAEACARLRALIDLPSFKHPQKRTILMAFALWSDHPALGFSDSLTAAHVDQEGLELATFDADFDVFPELTRYPVAA